MLPGEICGLFDEFISLDFLPATTPTSSKTMVAIRNARMMANCMYVLSSSLDHGAGMTMSELRLRL